jgi:uncharacterized protein YjbI with pentapeptide repeats
MDWELYDLLGYGGLTPEIVEYLMAMLTDSPEIDTQGWIRLFQRLNSFYDRWCEGELIDADPSENLPQKKMRLLKDQRPEQDKPLGLRQVDVFTGLNVLILLLELHRYAQDPEQSREELKQQIMFYPSGQVSEAASPDEITDRLLKIIHYADCLESASFTRIAGSFFDRANLTRANLTRADLTSADLTSANLTSAYLTSADLTRANLTRANLTSANLTSANLTSAYLTSADLTSANLTRADLTSADLSSANLTSANLTSANLTSANLTSADLRNADLANANLAGITWNENTRWQGVRGLETARNVPEGLKAQVDLQNKTLNEAEQETEADDFELED